MNKKLLFTIVFCFICSLILFSCNNFFDDSGETSLSVMLPYGSSARAADGQTFSFKINFIHSSGTDTLLEGVSGDKVTLNPAEPGDYKVVGKAFNDAGEIVYEGEVEATVVAGRESNVRLVMDRSLFEVEARTRHMTLTPDRKGVKITLFAVGGERSWMKSNCRLTETGSGTGIEVTAVPETGKPVEFYYPFTTKGKKYDFKLTLVYDGDYTEFYETASCTAAGGDDSYFDPSYKDYKTTKIILDSDAGTIKINRDILTYLNQEKIDAGKIKNMGACFDIISGRSDWADSDWIGNVLLTKYSQDGLLCEYDKLLSGVNIQSYLQDNYDRLANHYLWWGQIKTRFELADLPGQHFWGPDISSGECFYSKVSVENKNSEHVMLEPNAEGIKVTFKQGSEGTWADYTKLEDRNGLYYMGFNENEKPSLTLPKSYIINNTKAGEYYSYDFVLCNESGYVTTEHVFCKANGGFGDAIVIPEDWKDVKLDMDSESGTVKFSDSRIQNLVSVSASTLVSVASKFSDIFIYNEIRDGENRTVYNDKIYLLQSGALGTNISLYSNGIDINDLSEVGYMLAGYRKWSSFMKYSFKLKTSSGGAGTDSMIITLADITTEANYSKYTGKKFLNGTMNLNDANGWYVYLKGFEEDIPNFNLISSTATSIEFSIDRDFDNDNYEFQIVRGESLSGLNGGALRIQCTILCSQDSDLEINSNDGMKNITYINFNEGNGNKLSANVENNVDLDIGTGEHFTSDSDEFSFFMCPYTAGTYKISNITFAVTG